MIQSFADPETEALFNGESTKKTRRRLPGELHAAAYRKLDMLNAAHDLVDLRVPPGNMLEALKGDRAGSTPSASTNSTASASSGRTPAPRRSKSQTTTRGKPPCGAPCRAIPQTT